MVVKLPERIGYKETKKLINKKQTNGGEITREIRKQKGNSKNGQIRKLNAYFSAPG